jgi:ribosomal protein S12 methylthiotransferase accessory factor
MPRCSRLAIPPCWLPFLGSRAGLAKSLTTLTVDPDDFDVHHVVPSSASLGRLLSYPGEFEPRAGGVGATLSDAVNRAMGELVERYASLAYDGANRTISTYEELLDEGRRAIGFENLALFTREQRQQPDFPFKEFTPKTRVGWLDGTDLTDGSSVYVPGQLVSLGYAPGRDESGPCFYPSSSGCAVGFSVAAAVLAGLLEAIERDAVMIRWYARLAPPILDLAPTDLLPQPPGWDRYGLKIRFHDLAISEVASVVGVTCIEASGRPCRFLLSAAAALDTVAAARKALLEAAQGRPFVKLLANLRGAPSEREAFNDFDSNVRFFAEPSNARYVDWFSENETLSDDRYPSPPNVKQPADLLHPLLERCREEGIRPIAFDLTTPDLRDHGVFACKVLAPELVPLCVPSAPFLGHPRLAGHMASAEPNRAGDLPAWLPHPFP